MAWPSRVPPELVGATATEMLAWTDAHFGKRYVVASNMRDAVLIDLAAKVRPGVDDAAVPRYRIPLRRDHRHPGCRRSRL